MVWNSHLFKNIPQFVVIYTVKGFSIVSEAKVDVFLESPFFLYDSMNVGKLISGSSFSKSSLYIRKFSVHILLKPSLKNFEHNLTSMWSEHICMVVWTLFGTTLLWDWNENWLFQIPWTEKPSRLQSTRSQRVGHDWATSPPLALFVVMLPKAHLTSHSRMSGSRGVITPSWLSGSWRFLFVQFFCVFLPPLNIFYFR